MTLYAVCLEEGQLLRCLMNCRGNEALVVNQSTHQTPPTATPFHSGVVQISLFSSRAKTEPLGQHSETIVLTWGSDGWAVRELGYQSKGCRFDSRMQISHHLTCLGGMYLYLQ